MFIHQKPFALTLEFDDARFILVYYNHGISLNRTWYGYKKLMRKWKFFKNPAVFEGVANMHAPAIHCFVWYKGSLLPKKHHVSLQIKVVNFNQEKVNVSPVHFRLHPIECSVRSVKYVIKPLSSPLLSAPLCQINTPVFHIKPLNEPELNPLA